MSLRDEVIKLAHENPRLRGDLIPVLQKTAARHHTYDEDRMGNITITFADGSDAFMQGDDADTLRDEIEKLDKAAKRQKWSDEKYADKLDEMLGEYQTE